MFIPTGKSNSEIAIYLCKASDLESVSLDEINQYRDDYSQYISEQRAENAWLTYAENQDSYDPIEDALRLIDPQG